MSAVTRDVYAVFGALSERTAFIHRRVEGDALVFDVVLGEERHGHRLQFRVVGERVRRLLADDHGG